MLRLHHVSVEPCVEFHSMNIIIGVYVALMIMNGIIMACNYAGCIQSCYCQGDMTRMYKHSVAVVGVGYGMVIVSGIVCVYYNIIITWTIYFFYHSLRAVLPWSTCDNQWNTQKCYIRGESINLTHSSVQSFLQSNASEVNTTNAAQPSGNVNETSNATKVTASEEFWQ